MEWKIGEIREVNGEWYQCIPDTTDDNCNNCFFQKRCSDIVGDCSSTVRSDGKSVAFKKLEKVGEPYKALNRLFQAYKVFTAITDVGNYDVAMIPHYKTIDIEIKQTKEDMEEKKQKLDKLVDDYMACRIQYAEFDKEIKALYDKEESEPTLKEFDLKAAKAGKPVCTRDGRKARIVCFDSTLKNYPLVALVGDYPYSYTAEGKFNKDSESNSDLMMLPEKKEGWVNIYALNTCYSSKEEAKANIDRDYEHEYIRTVKITIKITAKK